MQELSWELRWQWTPLKEVAVVVGVEVGVEQVEYAVLLRVRECESGEVFSSIWRG